MINIQLDPTPTTFPLNPLTKIPAVPWGEYQGGISESTTTYGIDCGRSGLVVIDLDVHDPEKNGLLSWALLTQGQDLEDTFSVNTANGGVHYYYRDTSEGAIRNSVASLGPGIDVRANGGYVVGPGSRVKDSDGATKEYTVRNNVEIQPLPPFLRDLILSPSDTSSLLSMNLHDAIDGSPSTKKEPVQGNSQDKKITEALQAIVSATQGERNSTLNREVYRLAASGISGDEIKKRISMAAQATGLEADEIKKTIESAMEKGSKQYSAKKKEQAKADEELLKSPQSTPSGYFSDIVMTYRVREVLRKENYAFLAKRNQWVHYNEDLGIWEKLLQEDMVARVTEWCHDEVTRTAKTKNVDMIKASMRCLNRSAVMNVTSMCNAQLKLDPSLFDAQPDLLVVENGVVNLRTKEISEFRPEYYLTQRIPLRYDPVIKSPYVDKILDALPDDAREWFMIMAGQSITGHKPSSDTMFFLKGNGSNGKSTILNLMHATSGEYGGLPPQASLVRARNTDQFNTISYKGIRQAIVEELPDKQLDTTRMKSLTGTESITARGLYQNNETFVLHCTIWVSCNILPQVTEYDHGTWRRIALIDFKKTYHRRQSDVKGPNDRLGSDDVRLAALHDEKTKLDFLARRIEGAYQWYQMKMRDPELPESIVQATNAWRYSGDNIRLWMEECLEPSMESAVLNEDLRDSYNNWLEDHGYAHISHKVFLARLEDHPLFKEWKLVIARSSRYGKLKMSSWSDPKKSGNLSYQPRRCDSGVVSHVKYMRFK